MGARSGSANQDQQCETADELIRERLLLATSLPKAGFVTLQIGKRSTMEIPTSRSSSPRRAAPG